MTKAEEIFGATRCECKKHIEAWGYEVNPDGKSVGFCNVITDDVVCTRTLNAMEKILTGKRKDVEIGLKIGYYTEERADKERKILNMIESTINNARKLIA